MPQFSAAYEETVNRILRMKPKMTREEVDHIAGKEKAKAAGLLTDEAAVHLVAINLGVDNEEMTKCKITAKDVVDKAVKAATEKAPVETFEDAIRQELRDLKNKIVNLEARFGTVKDQAGAAADVTKELLERVGILEHTAEKGKIEGLIVDLTAAILDAKSVPAASPFKTVAPKEEGPAPGQQRLPTAPGYFNSALLNGVEWKDGQFEGSSYVFADKYPDLAQQLQAAGGKVEVDNFTVSIGKNPKYINKNAKKGGAQGKPTFNGGGSAFGGGGAKAPTNPNAPASPGQIGFLEKLGVQGFNGTMGQASELITQKKAEKGWK